MARLEARRAGIRAAARAAVRLAAEIAVLGGPISSSTLRASSAMSPPAASTTQSAGAFGTLVNFMGEDGLAAVRNLRVEPWSYR